MDAICKNCKTKHFAAENPQDGEFSSCCHEGKINLPSMTPPPEQICQKLVLEKYYRFKKLDIASLGMRKNGTPKLL